MNINSHFQYRTCDLKDISAIHLFREATYAIDPVIPKSEISKLVADRWDGCSTHFGLLNGNSLIGTVRLSHPIDEILPIHDTIDIKLVSPIVELSRGLIHPLHRNGIGALVLFRKVCAHIYRNPSNLITDVIFRAGHPGFRRQLFRMGLVDTGMRYWDQRYNAESAIFVGSKDVLTSRIEKRVWKLN